MRRSSKLPKDVNHRAAEIARVSTVEAPESVREYLARIGRQGGLKGGKARKERLTASERKAIAKKAAKARWSKKRV